MMVKLKKCPFCEGEAKVSHSGPFVSKTSHIECGKCGACTKYFFISTEYAADVVAAEAWNRRADDGHDN